MMTNSVKKPVCFVLMLLSAIALSPVQANEDEARPVFIMHSSQDPNSPTSDWLKRVYAELFRRIGVPLEVVYFPGQRANVAAQAGDIDGQFTRIYDYQKLFKDQLRINVPVIKLNTVAYARVEDNLFLPNGWSSFESLNLRIDYVRGIVISDLNLKQWVAPENLTNSTDLREGLLKLKYNRTDVFVHGNIAVEPALDGEEYKDVLTAAGLMDVTLLYPYIHTRHFEYAPKMESALNQMKQEGLLLQYCIDAYGEDYRLFCRSIQPLE